MRNPLSAENTLDTLLLKCLKYDINVENRENLPDFLKKEVVEDKVVINGKFLFQVKSHPKGNDVTAYLIDHKNLECLLFLNGTYTFSIRDNLNDFYYETGPWTPHLEKVKDKWLQSIKLEEERILNLLSAKKNEDDRRVAIEEKKKRFSTMFERIPGVEVDDL